MPPPNGSSSARRRPQTGSGGPPVRARRSAEAAVPGAAAGKLAATAGPAAGEEFTLSGDEAVIGRSSENAISIPDTSVSRKHVLLRKTPDGWAASDMGSGNGTLVNGEAIAVETRLKHGDVITLGDTELRFEDGSAGAGASRRPPMRRGGAEAGAAPVNTSGRTRAVVRTSRKGAVDQAEARNRRKKLVVRVGALLVVVLGASVAYRVYRTDLEKQRLLLTQSAQQHEQQLRVIKQEGNNLVREGKWKEAREKFLEVQQADPEFEAANLAQLLAAAEKEIPNQAFMQQAQEAIGQGEIARAAKALDQVTKDTTQYVARDKIKEALDKKISDKINDARSLLANPSDLAKMKELKTLVEDLLVARPEHRDALAYKQTADESIDRIEHPYVAPPAPDQPWLAVQSRFTSGDQTGAYSLAEAFAARFAQCRTLKTQLVDFGDRLKKAESAGAAELLALIELDKKIGGGQQSSLTRNVAKKTADSFYLKASSAKATGNWQVAIDYARKAISADPGHAGSQALLQDARTQAKDVYLRGYQMKDSNPDDAIKLFKDVLSMTPKDDEYHQKARARLEELAK